MADSILSYIRGEREHSQALSGPKGHTADDIVERQNSRERERTNRLIANSFWNSLGLAVKNLLEIGLVFFREPICGRF